MNDMEIDVEALLKDSTTSYNTVNDQMMLCKQGVRMILGGVPDEAKGTNEAIRAANGGRPKEGMKLKGEELPTVQQLLERYIALCGLREQGLGESEVSLKKLDDQLANQQNIQMMERLLKGGMGDVVYSMLTKTPENFMIDVGKKMGGKLIGGATTKQPPKETVRQSVGELSEEEQVVEEEPVKKPRTVSGYSDSVSEYDEPEIGSL